MTRLRLALSATLCLAPGLARADMTCAEFNGMDTQSQLEMIGAMAEAGEGGMNASETRESGEGEGEDAEVVADDGLARAVRETCAQTPGSALGAAVAAAGGLGEDEDGDEDGDGGPEEDGEDDDGDRDEDGEDEHEDDEDEGQGDDGDGDGETRGAGNG